MGKLLKKKKQKTKGKPARVKVEETSDSIVFSTPGSEPHAVDYSTAEARVAAFIDSEAKLTMGSSKIDVTEMGSTVKSYIDIEDVPLTPGPDETPPQYWFEDKNMCGEVDTVPHAGEPVRMNPVEMSERIERFRKTRGIEATSRLVAIDAERLKKFGDVLEDAVAKVTEEMNQQPAYPKTDEELDDELCMAEPADDDYESDEDYFIRFDYAQNYAGTNSTSPKPSTESSSFMYDITQYLGYNEVEELIADAMDIELDEAFEIHRTQDIVNRAIHHARGLMAGGDSYGSKKSKSDRGRCESIW